MKALSRRILLFGMLLTLASNIAYGWGGESHKRMTYLAWKNSGLPPSSSSVDVVVPVQWDLETIQKTLGNTRGDLQGFLLTLFSSAAQANFSIDTRDTIKAGTTDSALFYEWGRKPDDFDDPSAALKALFGHMYIPAGGGFADGMCKYFFDKAVSDYKTNKRRRAYAYLALSAHYLEDTGFPPHNEKNYLDPGADIWQAAWHNKIETWIGDSTNWQRFDGLCDTLARMPLPACDPAMAVHGLAWECTWYDQQFKDAATKSDKSELVIICRKCLQAIVPRVAGLFLAFKHKTQ
jgi:hypothetical protein